MKGYTVLIAAARVTPAVLRQVWIPEEKSVKDLLVLCAIALGLSPEGGALLTDSGDAPLQESLPLREVLAEDSAGVMRLEVRGERHGDSLTANWWLRGSAERPENLPEVLAAVGLNLPANRANPAEICRIFSQLNEQDLAALDGETYSRRGLIFAEKKTENALRMYFAPETARQELYMAQGLPLSLCLNSLTMPDLKYIADTNGVFYCNPIRKAELIGEICDSFDESFLKKLFGTMSKAEYQAFKKLAMNGAAMADYGRICEEIPAITRCGMVVLLKDGGVRVAAELLEYYDSWFGTEQEELFVRRMDMRTAADVCAVLYGVFGKPLFKKVLGKLNQVPERIVDLYWAELETGASDLRVKKLDANILYYTQELTKT